MVVPVSSGGLVWYPFRRMPLWPLASTGFGARIRRTLGSVASLSDSIRHAARRTTTCHDREDVDRRMGTQTPLSRCSGAPVWGRF